jgi:hypothetical protein
MFGGCWRAAAVTRLDLLARGPDNDRAKLPGSALRIALAAVGHGDGLDLRRLRGRVVRLRARPYKQRGALLQEVVSALRFLTRAGGLRFGRPRLGGRAQRAD